LLGSESSGKYREVGGEEREERKEVEVREREKEEAGSRNLEHRSTSSSFGKSPSFAIAPIPGG